MEKEKIDFQIQEVHTITTGTPKIGAGGSSSSYSSGGYSSGRNGGWAIVYGRGRVRGYRYGVSCGGCHGTWSQRSRIRAWNWCSAGALGALNYMAPGASKIGATALGASFRHYTYPGGR